MSRDLTIVEVSYLIWANIFFIASDLDAHAGSSQGGGGIVALGTSSASLTDSTVAGNESAFAGGAAAGSGGPKAKAGGAKKKKAKAKAKARPATASRYMKFA